MSNRRQKVNRDYKKLKKRLYLSLKKNELQESNGIENIYVVNEKTILLKLKKKK